MRARGVTIQQIGTGMTIWPVQEAIHNRAIRPRRRFDVSDTTVKALAHLNRGVGVHRSWRLRIRHMGRSASGSCGITTGQNSGGGTSSLKGEGL